MGRVLAQGDLGLELDGGLLRLLERQRIRTADLVLLQPPVPVPVPEIVGFVAGGSDLQDEALNMVAVVVDLLLAGRTWSRADKGGIQRNNRHDDPPDWSGMDEGERTSQWPALLAGAGGMGTRYSGGGGVPPRGALRDATARPGTSGTTWSREEGRGRLTRPRPAGP